MVLSGDADDLPSSAKALGIIGPKTVVAARSLLLPQQRSFFESEPPPHRESDGFNSLVRALIDQTARWTDEQAAALLQGLSDRKSANYTPDFAAVTRWVANHPNDAVSVLQCVDVGPPDEMDIIRVLSQEGSQKVVFLASWRSMQREVVLKQVIRADGTAVREMESFPLNLAHPNIIETHPLRNRRGELFFAELRLAEVLNDKWQASGIQDGANLLYDIATALKYLHDHKRVHGDVKPDNIGKDAGEYILLDFGICRPTHEFIDELTATGSLRTRAPELLAEKGYVDPPKVDVWALGATMFNAYSGRFPLISADEAIPRIAAHVERAAFEKILRERAQKEWSLRVDLTLLPEELRGIVAAMLERDPEKRISSGEVVERAGRDLPALIRGLIVEPTRGQRFSPLEELQQLSEFLDYTKLSLIPRRKIAELIARLRDLQGTPGFSKEDKENSQKLLTRLERS